MSPTAAPSIPTTMVSPPSNDHLAAHLAEGPSSLPSPVLDGWNDEQPQSQPPAPPKKSYKSHARSSSTSTNTNAALSRSTSPPNHPNKLTTLLSRRAGSKPPQPQPQSQSQRPSSSSSSAASSSYPGYEDDAGMMEGEGDEWADGSLAGAGAAVAPPRSDGNADPSGLAGGREDDIGGKRKKLPGKLRKKTSKLFGGGGSGSSGGDELKPTKSRDKQRPTSSPSSWASPTLPQGQSHSSSQTTATIGTLKRGSFSSRSTNSSSNHSLSPPLPAVPGTHRFSLPSPPLPDREREREHQRDRKRDASETSFLSLGRNSKSHLPQPPDPNAQAPANLGQGGWGGSKVSLAPSTATTGGLRGWFSGIVGGQSTGQAQAQAQQGAVVVIGRQGAYQNDVGGYDVPQGPSSIPIRQNLPLPPATTSQSHLSPSPTTPNLPLASSPSTSTTKKLSTSATAFFTAAKQKAVGGVRYLLESEAVPDSREGVWVMGVEHGFEVEPSSPTEEKSGPGSPERTGRKSPVGGLGQQGRGLFSPKKGGEDFGVGVDSPGRGGALKGKGRAVGDGKEFRWPDGFLEDFRSSIWCTYRSQYAPILSLPRDLLLVTPSSYSAPLPPLEPDGLSQSQQRSGWAWVAGGAGEKGLTSDAGWGCMLRTGQSMLANALMFLHLGRDWRRPLQPPALYSSTPAGLQAVRDYATYVQILSWFLDDPAATCPFSVHRMALVGKELGKEVGEWFGPSTASGAIKTLTNNFSPCGLAVSVASDGIIFRSDVLAASNSARPEWSDVAQELNMPLKTAKQGTGDWGGQAVLVLVGVRLGLEGVNPIYHESIKTLFTFPQSVGIAGGRPSSSYYFIGSQASSLFYLDPHFTRPAVPLKSRSTDPIDPPSSRDSRQQPTTIFEEPSRVITAAPSEHEVDEHTRKMVEAYTIQQLQTFHCEKVKKMPLGSLDPSMLLGFLCRDESDWEDFRERVDLMPLKIFSILDEPPSWGNSSSTSSLIGMESFSETDPAEADVDADGDEGLTDDASLSRPGTKVEAGEEEGEAERRLSFPASGDGLEDEDEVVKIGLPRSEDATTSHGHSRTGAMMESFTSLSHEDTRPELDLPVRSPPITKTLAMVDDDEDEDDEESGQKSPATPTRNATARERGRTRSRVSSRTVAGGGSVVTLGRRGSVEPEPDAEMEESSGTGSGVLPAHEEVPSNEPQPLTHAQPHPHTSAPSLPSTALPDQPHTLHKKESEEWVGRDPMELGLVSRPASVVTAAGFEEVREDEGEGEGQWVGAEGGAHPVAEGSKHDVGTKTVAETHDKGLMHREAGEPGPLEEGFSMITAVGNRVDGEDGIEEEEKAEGVLVEPEPEVAKTGEGFGLPFDDAGEGEVEVVAEDGGEGQGESTSERGRGRQPRLHGDEEAEREEEPVLLVHPKGRVISSERERSDAAGTDLV